MAHILGHYLKISKKNFQFTNKGSFLALNPNIVQISLFVI